MGVLNIYPMRTRPNAMSSKGIVTSSSTQASIVGSEIIKEGGNVVDAAIATSAVLCVTQNNLCGLGGDMFALVRFEGKGVLGFNGSGKAGSLASIDYYRKLKLSSIPTVGKLAAITVPGLVDGWGVLNKEYGSMEMSHLLKPAIELAYSGFPLSHNYAKSIEASSGHLSQFSWKDIFMPEGNVPEPGTIFRQRDLALTLRSISNDGTRSFYEGDLQDHIIKGLRNQDCLITEDDFRTHCTRKENPPSTMYHGLKIYETGPNSQGITTLIWLNLLTSMEQNGKNPEIEDVIRTGLIAYSQRGRWITDPDFLKPPDDLLSVGYATELLEERNGTISGKNSSDPGDTTYFTVADSDGNAVSMIQSNYRGFGSGIVPEGTGFVMQNRGSYFTLDETHHNSLKPGKRTFHTLCASIGERDGGLVFSLGTMGGDIQPQIHVQLMKNIVDTHMDPQLALDSPRWAMPYTIYDLPGKLLYEEINFPEKLVNIDKRIEFVYVGSGSSHFGHSQALVLSKDGILMGGADPRGDGIAMPVL